MSPENEYWLRRKIADGWMACDAIDEMVRQGMIQNYKQGLRTLEKWARKREWNYGVSIDTGWFEEPKGGDAPMYTPEYDPREVSARLM